ncbi:MAG: hypothetical protein ACI4CT_09410 [Lachnospiraceae bacterium]
MRSRQKKTYIVMHGNQPVVTIRDNGMCVIHSVDMLPYNLYLEEGSEIDIDLRVQNLNNFYYWCATRVLTLDRQYAKEILNSIGATQASTDRERAQIALSYHCLSLMDIYWTKEPGEEVAFSDINLFDNHLEKAFIDVTLRGKQISVQNRYVIADDLGTPGCFPKAWVRREDGFWLLKDGGVEFVENELLASKICRCFRVNQVLYEASEYDGQKVSVSKMMTSLDRGIVPIEHFQIYALNHDIDKMHYILNLDGYSYYMMNILDYLIGNTDRHWGNWGVLIDNKTNQPIRLHDLMDFNQAFQAYETLDGANCLTADTTQTQREAAIAAVKEIGLNQICDIEPEWFPDFRKREMFYQRLNLLK